QHPGGRGSGYLSHPSISVASVLSEVRRRPEWKVYCGAYRLFVVLVHELAYAAVGIPQNVVLRQEYGPEMLGPGFLAEAGAVDDEDCFFPQKLLYKIQIKFRNVDFREGVESALGLYAADAWIGVDPVHGDVAPGPQLGIDFLQVILRAFQRRLNGPLHGMTCAKT